LSFEVLGHLQPRVPNPDAARMVRVQSMSGSKLLQTLNCAERRFGTVGTPYEGCFARESDGLRHSRALRSTLACVAEHLRSEPL